MRFKAVFVHMIICLLADEIQSSVCALDYLFTSWWDSKHSLKMNELGIISI